MERHFNEEQVSEIMQRAAEHQARQRPAGAPGSSNVSESELVRVATEMGIDPESLQVAISEVSVAEAADTGTLKSVDRILERSVEGDLSAEDLGVVLQEFPPAGAFGSQPATTSNTLSYQSVVGLAHCRLNVTNRNGKTTLRVKSSAYMAALATFFPALFLSLIANVIIWEEIRPVFDDGIMFAVLIPAALLTAAYFGFRTVVRNSNSKVLDLVNRTAAKLAESAEHLRRRLAKSGIPLPDVAGNVDSLRENLAETDETPPASRAESRQDRSRD